MFVDATTYRRGSGVVVVLPGESHSAAWVWVNEGGPEPASYPCAGAERIRRRTRRRARREPHRRPRPAVGALP